MGGHRRGRRPEDTPASTTTTSEFTAAWYLQKQKRENLPYWEYYQINEHELYIELELLLLQQQLLLAGHSISSSSPTSSSNREDTTKSNLYYSVSYSIHSDTTDHPPVVAVVEFDPVSYSFRCGFPFVFVFFVFYYWLY